MVHDTKLCTKPNFLRLGFAFLFCLICEVHAATFQTFFVKQSSSLAGANNVLTFRIVVSRKVERGDALIFKGLTGTQTQDTISLSLGGSKTDTFGTSGSWKQDSGELEIQLLKEMSPLTVYDLKITLKNGGIPSAAGVKPSLKVKGQPTSTKTSDSAVLKVGAFKDLIAVVATDTTDQNLVTLELDFEAIQNIEAAEKVVIGNLLGSGTITTSTLRLSGSCASNYITSRASWDQNEGTLTLTTKSQLPKNTLCMVTFKLARGTGKTLKKSPTIKLEASVTQFRWYS